MIRAQTLLLDVKIVLGDTTAQSFALVGPFFNGTYGDKFKVRRKYSLKQGQEATDKLMLQGIQDPGDKAGR
jgi:hypothetical protein